MAGIGEAGAEHAFVAGDDDRAVVVGLDVGDEGEPGRGSAVRRPQREIALVDPHGDLHDLGRQVHVLVGDAAEMRDGPFHQAGDFLEQARIIHDRQGFLRGEAGDAVGDDALAVVGVDQHFVREQLLSPVGGAGDGESAGGVEAVALGKVAAGQAVAVVGSVAQVERHDHAVEQAGDAAQRAHPDEGAGAAPAHGFGPRKAAEHARDCARRSALRRTRRPRISPAPSSRLPGEVARGRRCACAETRSAPAPERWHAGRVRWSWRRRYLASTSAAKGDAAGAGECLDQVTDRSR